MKVQDGEYPRSLSSLNPLLVARHFWFDGQIRRTGQYPRCLNPLLVARHFWSNCRGFRNAFNRYLKSQSSLSSEAFLIKECIYSHNRQRQVCLNPLLVARHFWLNLTKKEKSKYNQISLNPLLVARHFWSGTENRISFTDWYSLNPLLVARHFWSMKKPEALYTQIFQSQSSLSSEAFLIVQTWSMILSGSYLSQSSLSSEAFLILTLM